MAVYGVFTGSGTGSVGSGDIFTWGGYSLRDTGGVGSSTWGGHSSHVFIGSGGGGEGILDIFARGECSSRVFIGTGTGGVGSSMWDGAFLPCLNRERRLHRRLRLHLPAAEVTGGIHVSGSGVGPPAVVGASPTPPASDPSVGAGAATGELLATEQEQEQLVASGGLREVLAEVSRMAGGTSPVGPGALPAASPAPPGPPPTSEEMRVGMVHTAVLADVGKDSE